MLEHGTSTEVPHMLLLRRVVFFPSPPSTRLHSARDPNLHFLWDGLKVREMVPPKQTRLSSIQLLLVTDKNEPKNPFRISIGTSVDHPILSRHLSSTHRMATGAGLAGTGCHRGAGDAWSGSGAAARSCARCRAARSSRRTDESSTRLDPVDSFDSSGTGQTLFIHVLFGSLTYASCT